MEPFSVCAGIGMVTIVASSFLKSRADHKQWEKAARLPEILRKGDEDELITMIAVDVRRVEVLSCCCSGDLRVHVELWEGADVLGCHTSSFSPACLTKRKLAVANPKSMCLLALRGIAKPSLSLKLCRVTPGLGKKSVAQANLPLGSCSLDMEQTLFSRSNKAIGQVFFGVGICTACRRDLLRALVLASAQKQRDGYMISSAVPLVVGEVANQNIQGSESDQHVKEDNCAIGSPRRASTGLELA
mmetsp:Transcript_102754/g.257689  ORF Transcript_102754/g.257689 Transcript_102754/m.257689 type:complete len:244 (+) Transcript_102754:64-795(+)